MTCAAFDHNLLFGNLVDVSSRNLQGADCNLGTTGNYDWSSVPGGSLFFLVVGVDDTIRPVWRHEQGRHRVLLPGDVYQNGVSGTVIQSTRIE
jgi:hypothetical protein